MTSPVDICNDALSHIGSDATVSAIDPPDGSVEAGHCARWYPRARTRMLQRGAWNFARTRVLLAEVTNTSNRWLYAYALPSDCLQPLRVIGTIASPGVGVSGGGDLVPFGSGNMIPFGDSVGTQGADNIGISARTPGDRLGEEYEVEGQVIFTNVHEATLIYRRDVTDVTKFPATFVSALGYLLASYLAGPIVKGRDGVSLAQALREVGLSEAADGERLDANAGNERAYLTTPSGVMARR